MLQQASATFGSNIAEMMNTFLTGGWVAGSIGLCHSDSIVHILLMTILGDKLADVWMLISQSVNLHTNGAHCQHGCSVMVQKVSCSSESPEHPRSCPNVSNSVCLEWGLIMSLVSNSLGMLLWETYLDNHWWVAAMFPCPDSPWDWKTYSFNLCRCSSHSSYLL